MSLFVRGRTRLAARDVGFLFFFSGWIFVRGATYLRPPTPYVLYLVNELVLRFGPGPVVTLALVGSRCTRGTVRRRALCDLS